MRDRDLERYYAERASEYDDVYRKPGRGEDLEWLATRLMDAAAGREVVELACGTGAWTRHLAKTATRVLATDVVQEVLLHGRHAKTLGPWPHKALPVRMDAFRPSLRPACADLVVCGFLWSHLPRGGEARLLEPACRLLRPGGRFYAFDNRFVDGSSSPIAGTDGRGNTFQDRVLKDGSRHRVRKNFPSAGELEEAGRAFGSTLVETSRYFWLLEIQVPE